MQQPLQRQKKNRNRQYRRAKNLNNAGGIHSPNKKWQAEPGQPRGSHLVNGDNEIQSGKDRRKSHNKHAYSRGNHLRMGISAAIRRIERPPSIHAATIKGTKKFPSTAGIDGIKKKKTITTP